MNISPIRPLFFTACTPLTFCTDHPHPLQISFLIGHASLHLGCHQSTLHSDRSFQLFLPLPCWFLTSILPVIIPPELRPSVPAGRPSASWPLICGLQSVCESVYMCGRAKTYKINKKNDLYINVACYSLSSLCILENYLLSAPYY